LPLASSGSSSAFDRVFKRQANPDAIKPFDPSRGIGAMPAGRPRQWPRGDNGRGCRAGAGQEIFREMNGRASSIR